MGGAMVQATAQTAIRSRTMGRPWHAELGNRGQQPSHDWDRVFPGATGMQT